MKLDPRARSHNGEPIVPLINVVFLLLIFLMLSSKTSLPDPFVIDPVRSSSEVEDSDNPHVLSVSSELEIAYGTARGEADVLSAIAAVFGAGTQEPLEIKADGAADTVKLLALIRRLKAQGVQSVRLVTQRRQ
ncbi:MAG: ExbD/TolR family protein [Methyloligellaceae bacterium]